MRYTDKVDLNSHFLYSNQLAQQADFEILFGEIHRLSGDVFDGLYIQRKTKLLEEKELLSDISKITIAKWNAFTNRYGEEIDLHDEMRKAQKGKYALIQLLAPVGNGKTTFIHHFLTVSLPKLLGPTVKIETIIFDVRKEDISNERMAAVLYSFINNELERRFPCFGNPKDEEEFYETTHKIELKLFSADLNRKGVGANVHPLSSDKYVKQREIITAILESQPTYYLNQKIRYIKELYENTKILFCLDNIDLFAHYNTSHAVSILNQISENLEIDTFITLRDTTYRLCHSLEPSSAWARPKSIILMPSDMKDVGIKRLLFLKEKLIEGLGEKHRICQFLKHILWQWEHYKRKSISYNLFVLWEWMDSLGNHNLRDILDILKNAMRSYHLTSPEFRKERADTFFRYDGRSDINIKRFKTALINGYLTYYSAEKSGTNVVNLFDEGRPDWRFHYVFRLKVLQYLRRAEVFTISDIIKYIEGMYGRDITAYLKRTLKMFLKQHLIGIEVLANDRSAYSLLSGGDIDIEDSRISESTSYVTPNGIFHLDTLIYDDIYLDEMKYVTDHNKQNYERLFKSDTDENAQNRKISTKIFTDFINDAEDREYDLGKNFGVEQIGQEIRKRYIEAKSDEAYFIGKTYDRFIEMSQEIKRPL